MKNALYIKFTCGYWVSIDNSSITLMVGRLDADVKHWKKQKCLPIHDELVVRLQ
jgi:hypothetical protein